MPQCESRRTAPEVPTSASVRRATTTRSHAKIAPQASTTTTRTHGALGALIARQASSRPAGEFSRASCVRRGSTPEAPAPKPVWTAHPVSTLARARDDVRRRTALLMLHSHRQATIFCAAIARTRLACWLPESTPLTKEKEGLRSSCRMDIDWAVRATRTPHRQRLYSARTKYCAISRP